MYADYWGLRGPAFRNALDDRWFFESPAHAEALARLLFVIEERRTCGVLCGAEGTGKSLVLRRLVRAAGRNRRAIADVDLAGIDGHEFLWRLAGRLGLGPKRADGPARLWRTLDDHLAGLASSRRQTVFAFDHADQTYPDCGPVLERLLHLAERLHGAITVLMAVRDGAESMSDAVARFSDLRIELAPLDARQTARFVAESLRHAGCERDVFHPRAVAALFEESRGVPRRVNRLCELSLLAAMGDNLDRVDARVVRGVAAELAP